ncbi:MAG TPA: pseudouridine-5'-phosphate glycosidase [Geminicoccaceae bacterium]|nr:pseudouridine-5'-phosphate glycosidase [Geminicoccus sp.]HMU50607.1 pseudouridine-5'-phosphate glycosidase [Geminicoccaceae bacterium]
MDLSPEVADALSRGEAVVALESTLICHGIPRPRNLELAVAVETAVREAGAVPATVAVLDGRLRIGLAADELARLATTDSVVKCSTRDLAWVIAAGCPGATTVAATIHAATKAGIRVMATGGLGGVHRGGHSSLDISADLAELARSAVAVVCSGAKSILDLPRTLEVLETMGVTVLGLGTEELPAFYARESGLAIPAVADAAAAAAVLSCQAALGWPNGIVLANPPPADLAMPPAVVERLVEGALAACRAAGVSGKDETPFLLAHMARASDGRTVALNEALVLANARVAGEIAAIAADAM